MGLSECHQDGQDLTSTGVQSRILLMVYMVRCVALEVLGYCHELSQDKTRKEKIMSLALG